MDRPHPIWRAAFATAVLGFALVLVRLAWIGDDTFITLRVVENLVLGHGPVWNPGERVQAYTHPLWMFLLAGGRMLHSDGYHVAIALSLAFSLVALLLVTRPAGWRGGTAILWVLLASRSFGEYTVSGLENPLAFALLGLFAIRALAEGVDPYRRTLELSLLAALLALTRLDFVLLCAPAVLLSARGQSPFRFGKAALLGGLPLLAWLGFSAFYYGSPFPITAFAKAFSPGVPQSALLKQGWHYAAYVARHDPWTLVVIAASIGIAFRRPGMRGLGLGALLYCAYVFKVGGDFMGGRFFTPPLFLGAAVLSHVLGRDAQSQRASSRALALGIAAAVAVFVPTVPNWLSRPGSEPYPVAEHGIMDERAFYYRGYGLLSPHRVVPVAGALSAGLRAMGRDRPVVTAYGMVGAFGYEGGDLQHVVDPWLLDPLLMRLPVGQARGWRPGHFVRHVPPGYFESLARDQNLLHDRRLAAFYEILKPVLRSPLWERERLVALWQLWTGARQADLDRFVEEAYRSPPRISVSAAELEEVLAPSELGTGPQWFDEPRARVLYLGGLSVAFANPTRASRLRLQVQGGSFMRYEFRFLRDGAELHRAEVDASDVRAELGMVPRELELPADLPAFDSILVDLPNYPSHRIGVLGSLIAEP